MCCHHYIMHYLMQLVHLHIVIGFKVSSMLCLVGPATLMTVGIIAVLKGEVKAKIKISPVVVFGVLSRMVVVQGS